MKYPFDEWGFQTQLTVDDHLFLMKKVLKLLAETIDMLEEACDEHPGLIADLMEARDQYMVMRHAYRRVKHGEVQPC